MKEGQIDFKMYLKNSAREIERELRSIASEWDLEVNQFKELQKINHYFTQNFFGGKMLRGTLVKLGFELVAKPNKAILKPAASFEILHSALLIHDDIIDQSPIRRGKPALHMRLKSKQYGMSQALCLGDIGIALAIKHLSKSNFPIETKNQALIYFLQIITDTIIGEMLDVASTQTVKRTEKQIQRIHKMKTAQYTIVGPLTLGALLGGGTNELLNNLKLFGEYLGIAYQLQDDILGIFGDEKTIGKSTTSDSKENKGTLLITYALKHGTKEQQVVLKKFYGNKKIGKNEQKLIQQIFVSTGALSYSQNMINNYVTKAKKYIPHLTGDHTKQQLLFELADLLVLRIK